MPANTNTAWKSDMYKFVQKSFDFEYANEMSALREIVGEVTTNSADYRIQGLGGYGELGKYNGQLTAMDQSRGFTTIITPEEYAQAIDIKKKYARNDQQGVARATGKQAAKAASNIVYLNVLRMFGNAFNPNVLGADGQPWASNAHPNASKGDANGKSIIDPDSGTFSNLVTKKLSLTAITEAQSKANRFKTPDGLPFSSRFDTLLVSPELEPLAKTICGDDGELTPQNIPGSAENGANPVYGMKYIVIGGGDDGFSAKQWAIADRSLLQEAVKIIYNEKPTVYQTQLDDPLIDRYVPYVDFAVGYGDARPIIFSNPA